MKIYVVRHGETPWNALKKIQGTADIPLNEKGIGLAKMTGKALQGISFDAAFSSPLKRAYETAKCILMDRKIPIIVDQRLREISFGVMEGTCLLENNGGEFAENFQLFFHEPLRYQAPAGGETLKEVCDRTGDFLSELLSNEKYEDSTILVASHGCAVRAMLQRFYHDDLGFWHGKVPPNCSVNIIEAKHGTAVLKAEDQVYY